MGTGAPHLLDPIDVLTAHAATTPNYDVVAVDWPLAFKARSPKGEGRTPQRKYLTLPVEVAVRIPLRQLCARNAAVLIWKTKADRAAVDRLFEIWKLRYVTRGFVWVKLPGNFGGGYYSRARCEIAHIGAFGRPKVRSHSVDELITAPRRAHSEKPQEFYARLEQMFGSDVRRLDMFARVVRPFWCAWGNEIPGYLAEALPS